MLLLLILHRVAGLHQVIDVLLLMLLLLMLHRVSGLHFASRPSGANSTGDRTGAGGEPNAAMPIRSTNIKGVKMMSMRCGTELSGMLKRFVGRGLELMLVARGSESWLMLKPGGCKR